jgi:hypothetical protein
MSGRLAVSFVEKKERGVEKPAREPLFTIKELLALGVMAIVYTTILFSLDPEWVAWAAPLALGGALYAQDPPPASAHLGLSQQVFQTAYLYSMLSLLALGVVTFLRHRQSFSSLSWLEVKNKGMARLRSYLRSMALPMSGR